MSKCSVLLVTPTFPPAVNGLAHVSHAYATSLRDSGYEVEVFTPGLENYEYEGLRVVCFPLSGSFSLRSPLTGAVREYRKYLSSHSADLAICHAFQSAATDLALAFFPGKKVYHSHGISWRSGISDQKLRAFARRISYLPYELIGPALLRRADGAIFLGRAPDSDRTFDEKFFRQKPSRVIPNASFFPPGQPREFSAERKLRLLVVGSCTREKGFGQLAQLLPLLDGSHVCSLTICTMTASPFLREFLASARVIKAFPINFVFDRIGGGLQQYYENSDLLLNLSLSECYPLVMADAVNMRLPTLCFDTGYQREISGAKVFVSVEAVAEYINEYPLHAKELRFLSASTQPRSWRAASDELMEFLNIFAASPA